MAAISWGTGRKDYSTTVDRIYQIMPMPTTSPQQHNFFWSSSFNMPAYSELVTNITTVPTGQRLLVLHARFSIPSSTLITVHLTVNGSSFAQGYGYGVVDIALPNGFILTAGQTIGIVMINWDPSETYTFRYYIQGLNENILK